MAGIAHASSGGLARFVRILPVVALFLTGCVVSVPHVLRKQDIPPEFTGPRPAASQTWPQMDWWRQSATPELVNLLAAAERDNLDLSIAATRVLQAQAQLQIQRATLFPQFAARAQADRVGGNQLLSALPFPIGVNARGATPVYGVTLNTVYPLDVWGLAHAKARSASEGVRAAQFSRQAVALTVISNVANGYLSVLALRERIALANDNIAAINRLLDVIKLRVSTGTSSRLDLARQEAQLQAVASRVPLLQFEEQATMATLAVLLGRVPEGFEISASDMDALKAPSVSPGLPSELLVRRPDIAAAEAELASAHANVRAARAAFLPQVILSGTGLFASPATSTLFRCPNLAWNLSANVLQTVFDGGTLGGRKRLAVAVQAELLAAYRLTVLNAYADVEIALRAVSDTQTAETYLLKEVDAAREAFEITQLQYRQGVFDLLAVLQAQDVLFGAEDQLVQTKLARMQATVQLYQALGGGWTETRE